MRVVHTCGSPSWGPFPGLRVYDATTTDKETIDKGVVNGTRTVETKGTKNRRTRQDDFPYQVGAAPRRSYMGPRFRWPAHLCPRPVGAEVVRAKNTC